MFKKIKNYILIKTNNLNLNSIIIKLNNQNISIYDCFISNNKLYIKILEDDLEKINKYYKYLNFEVVRYYGQKHYFKLLKKYYLLFISLSLSLFLVFFFSNFIVDINIQSENEKLKNILLVSLSDLGIKKYTLKKSFSQIETVKEKIKNENNDIIDWLEIEVKGMRYIVSVEEKVIKTPVKENTSCDVYAKKDGLVKTIRVEKGTSYAKMNTYVKKGDLLISKDIYLNENVVGSVCAKGSVYAQVYYTVNINMPFEMYEEKKTKKKRYNFVFNIDDKDYVILNNRIKNFTSENKLLFSGLGIKFYLRKDTEIKKIKKTYSENEIIKKALENAKEKINLSIKEKDEIIYEKVLQKTINDSTMNIDIFIVTLEDIAN